MATTQSKFHQFYAQLGKVKSVNDLLPTLRLAFKNIAQNQDQLFSLLPQLGAGHVDAPLQGTGNQIAVPPTCQFSGTQSGGVSYLTIVDPQDRTSASAQQRALMTQSSPNTVLTPIIHELRSSSNQNFDATGNVQYYQRVPNHFSKPDPNQFWQLRSSFDGRNFNAWSATKQI
jgi:hypothetical protein